MSGSEAPIVNAVIAVLTFLRDLIKPLCKFNETDQKRWEELDGKADTLKIHIGSINQQTDAIPKYTTIKDEVTYWLKRAQDVVDEHSSFRDQFPRGRGWFSNPGWRCKAIKKLKKLDSRLTEVTATRPTGEVFQSRTRTLAELKEVLEEIGKGSVRMLRSIIKDVKLRVEFAAKAEDEIILNTVKHWLQTSEEVVREHSTLLAECDRGETSNGSRCKDLNTRVDKLESSLNDAIANQPPKIVSTHRPPQPIAPMNIANVDDFEMNSSTETALEEVMDALKSQGVTVVGVHGPPGVGKTKIMQRAAAKATAEGEGKLFAREVRLTISRSPDLEKIRKDIALRLQGSADQMMGQIKRKKNVLIVLDDIWEESVLTEVGIPNGSDLERTGSKIVFTTRNDRLCSLMKCQKQVPVKIWSKEEARGFFKKTARTTEDFEEIANSVADECKMLPLALMVVAKALQGQSLQEWNSALYRLQNSKWHHDKIFSCVKLSYDCLKPEARMCFLLCCLFPEDHNISCEELSRYAFGLNIFPQDDSVNEVRRTTCTTVRMLTGWNLLLPGDLETVKMHDVIRDVAIQIASDNNYEEQNEETKGGKKQVFIVQTRNKEQQEWPTKNSYEVYTAISIISNRIHELTGTPDCPNLEILLLQDNPNLTKITDIFFNEMKALRLLDLKRVRTNLLPPSTKSLKMLRTLLLDGCERLKDFSVLGELENLAILSLRESVIEEVPESMGKLGNLRTLDLTSSRSVKRIPPYVFSRMLSLEELYLKGSFSQWHDETDQETIHNASFSELINLHRLKILEVDFVNVKPLLNFEVNEAPTWSKFDICVHNNEEIRSINFNPPRPDNVSTKNLLIETSIMEFPDWFIRAVLMKTEKVMYMDSKNVNMFDEQARGRLTRLKCLVLDQFNEVPYFTWDMSDRNPVFESLEELDINDSSISQIFDGDLPPGSFKNLKSLTVKNCHKMEATALSSSFIMEVHNLTTLYVRRATARAVFTLPENHVQEQRYLGKLREMRLKDLYKLETVWKAPARFADFGNLKLVSIINCEELMDIFSIDICNSLSKLEHLWVRDCNKMKAIIGDNNEEITTYAGTLTLPNLKTLRLSNLPKLTNFCSHNLKLLCPVLVHVHIHNCIDFPITYFNSSKEVQKINHQHMKGLKKRVTQEYI